MILLVAFIIVSSILALVTVCSLIGGYVIYLICEPINRDIHKIDQETRQMERDLRAYERARSEALVEKARSGASFEGFR